MSISRTQIHVYRGVCTEDLTQIMIHVNITHLSTMESVHRLKRKSHDSRSVHLSSVHFFKS